MQHTSAGFTAFPLLPHLLKQTHVNTVIIPITTLNNLCTNVSCTPGTQMMISSLCTYLTYILILNSLLAKLILSPDILYTEYDESVVCHL